MIAPIPPHGGALIDRLLTGDARLRALEEAARLPKLRLNETALADLELIATGGFSPLTGFMDSADYRTVVDEMRLASGLPWSIPIVLPVPADQSEALAGAEAVALLEEDRPIAILRVTDRFTVDVEREAERVYRTTDAAHPGVARLYQAGAQRLGGPIEVIDLPTRARTEFAELRFTPAQTRQIFAERGWRRIVGFQTRNPIHRAHEYIQKTALEIVDGLLVHPLVGETKADDIPADIRIESYRAVLDVYYPAERVLLAVFPAAMRYAGPREAILHAIARKNYGCTHFIVGRDHAGVGNYYGSYDAHHIFDQFSADEIGITPLFFEHTFYCRRCGGVVSLKTCPHDPGQHVTLSGTQVRALLARGELLPEEFTRPEVSRVLMRAMRPNGGA
ncbi:MAG: sulfate adenylyltransferase [Candidatus Flexifilum sp.]